MTARAGYRNDGKMQPKQHHADTVERRVARLLQHPTITRLSELGTRRADALLRDKDSGAISWEHCERALMQLVLHEAAPPRLRAAPPRRRRGNPC